MKHTLKVQFPSLFSKKKEPEVVTEVDVKEVIDDIKSKPIPTPVVIALSVTSGLVLGYLIGHRSGVTKSGNIIVIK